MHLPPQVPYLVFVCVLTPGGPYRAGDILSVAFAVTSIGRLAAHAAAQVDVSPAEFEPVVPESITVEVVLAAGPYRLGDFLTLSFFDPRVARIHPCGKDRRAPPVPTSASVEGNVPASAHELNFAALEVMAITSASRGSPADDSVFEQPLTVQTDADGSVAQRGVSGRRMPRHRRRPGVRVALDWDRERALRFVHVVDKLFTIDRLGWYRHVLAVRMLVPDNISTGDPLADEESGRALGELRTAVAQSFGGPLLAACMPNFCVTPEWLDELDGVAASRAAAAMRQAIATQVVDDAFISESELSHGARSELSHAATF